MSEAFHTLDDVEAFLDKRGLFHVDLALDRIGRALSALDLGHPSVPVVQILGTNGKGSTATFLADLCEAHGLSTGLYTSPHFLSFRERIRLRGASDADWLCAANVVASVADDLTYFEFLTVLALQLFKTRRVSVILLEAGLGGAHDATSAVFRTHQVYTPIALDHTDILGHDLADIARDKAAAMAPGARVVSASQFPAVRDILEQRAKISLAHLSYADPLPADLYASVGMRGAHQRENAGLALSMWRYLAQDCSVTQNASCIRRALHGACIPGRMESVPAGPENPPLLLDGAHNPHGMQTVIRSLPEKPSVLVFSCLADKDWRSVLRLLRQSLHDIPVCFPRINNPRALAAPEIARAWFGENECASLLPVGLSVADTLRRLAGMHTGLVLVTGSLYLLGEVFAAIGSGEDELTPR